MPQYYCPLCEQEVSKTIYEKITGIWKEKEKRLVELKLKEKKILKREKKLRKEFEDEKKKISAVEQAKWEKELLKQKSSFDMAIKKEKKELLKQKSSFDMAIKKEKEAIRKEKQSIKRDFEKKLSTEINRIKRLEQLNKIELKRKFKNESNIIIEREQKKLQREKKRLEKSDRDQMNKYNMLNKQFISMRKQSDKKIKSLEEQIRKNQTPQVLGLLEEKIFLDKLKKMFSKDKFEHTGRGGDIVHYVINRGKEIGVIVYELKKVMTFNNKHIDQTLRAKQQRNADYGMLVTNAKRPKDNFGFLVEKGVIIIHPAGILVLVSILRDHLVTLSKLKLTRERRDQAVADVLNYIQSPSFKNSIERIIIDTEELYLDLQKEVKGHLRTWELRLSKYRSIHSGAIKIENNVVKLLSRDENQTERISDGDRLISIGLPTKIK